MPVEVPGRGRLSSSGAARGRAIGAGAHAAPEAEGRWFEADYRHVEAGQGSLSTSSSGTSEPPRVVEAHRVHLWVPAAVRREGLQNGARVGSMVIATFGFVDLAGFTALTEAHGDAEAVDMLVRFEATTKASLGHSGRLVKTIGDAVMLAFDEPTAAVTAVVALFEAMQGTDLPVARCGLHHGAAVERNGDYFGAAVNLAARIAAQAHGGQVVATSAVAEAARGAGVPVADLGCFDLRNIAEPVELFHLQIRSDVDATAIDPVCRMRVSPVSAAGRLRHGGRYYWFCSLRCASIFTADPERVVAGPTR